LNWDDEHIINGNDHAWSTRYVATSLQSSARGFILTRAPYRRHVSRRSTGAWLRAPG
jgi:hypothetical protein